VTKIFDDKPGDSGDFLTGDCTLFPQPEIPNNNIPEKTTIPIRAISKRY
jgi:hypothetical protein